MSRIPEIEKILAVKAYLQGEGTTHSQAARLGVAESTFREWVTKYKTFGESGLRSSTKRMQYAAETKNAAVTAYLSGRGSQKEICEQYKIKDKKTLREWIEVYNGHKELRPNEGRGSDIYMTIIISRSGADDHALWAAKGSLRENGKLILCLSDQDLLEMLDMKDRGNLPAEFLSALLDDFLMHLEK